MSVTCLGHKQGKNNSHKWLGTPHNLKRTDNSQSSTIQHICTNKEIWYACKNANNIVKWTKPLHQFSGCYKMHDDMEFFLMHYYYLKAFLNNREFYKKNVTFEFLLINKIV